MKKIMIFASGGGSNFIAIHKNTLAGKILNVHIEGLVSNNASCGAVSYASDNNIKTYIINSVRFKSDKGVCNRLIDVLEEHKIDLLVLAGYMKLIPEKVVNKYKNQIINIHPSYLPEYGGRGYYGLKVHEAVLRDGKDYTGVSIHYVNNKYDEGKIIFQKKIEVKDKDDLDRLSQRVLSYEHIIYSEVINMLCRDNEKGDL